MRLKWKIGIGIFAVIVFATVVNVAVISYLIRPSFQKLDERAARAQGVHAQEFLTTERRNLQSINHDWAQWSQTYSFAADHNRRYFDRLSPENLKILRVDSFAIADNAGIVTFEKSINGAATDLFATGKPLPAGAFDKAAWRKDGTSSVSGVVATPAGPVLMSISPIFTPAGGPQRGYLVFSRLLAPMLASHVHETGQPAASLTPFRPGDERTAANGPVPDHPRLAESGDTLTARYVLRDMTGKPSYVLHVPTARQFDAIGDLALSGAMARFIGFSIVFFVIMTWMIGRLVVKPLTEMAGQMSRIAETGDLEHRLEIDRSDEIGWVADVFNRMIEELDIARGRLIEQSYSTGMADLAAGILNNVRNALDPVIDANMAATKLVDKVETNTLAEAGRELSHSTIDQERREKLAIYIAAFSEGTKIRLDDVKHQLDRIDQSARHIRNILEDHQSLTKWPRETAVIDAAALIEEAAQGISYADDVPIDLEISHGSGDLPPVLGHAFILRQVIGNLLANSIDAIRRAHRKRGRIHILTRKAEPAGLPMVEIIVGDNGAGFTGIQADKLFDRGYSTRSDRPGGFGLHWCRTALSAMNASIIAQSPGPGLGATFRIFLPMAQPETLRPDTESGNGDSALKGAA